jgi:hypothetical protein
VLLELEAGVTGRIGKSLDTAVVLEAAAVEDDRSDPGIMGTGTNEFPDLGRGIDREGVGRDRRLLR